MKLEAIDYERVFECPTAIAAKLVRCDAVAEQQFVQTHRQPRIAPDSRRAPEDQTILAARERRLQRMARDRQQSFLGLGGAIYYWTHLNA